MEKLKFKDKRLPFAKRVNNLEKVLNNFIKVKELTKQRNEQEK